MYPYVHTSLLTTGKTWKQPQCPLMDGWIKIWWMYLCVCVCVCVCVHPHSGILLGHKKEWSNATCSYMDGPQDYHTKWGKSERERPIAYTTIHTQNLKNDTNTLIYETETDSQTQRTDWLRERGRGARLAVWDWQTQLLCMGWRPTRSYCRAQETTLTILQ